jgi:6-phosphogluconolactonase
MTDRLRLYIGRYTEADAVPQAAPGVIVAEFDPRGLTVEPLGGAHLPEASFLALSPAGDVLYAASERDEGRISAYAVTGERGELIPLGDQPTDGALPCHLVVDPSGGHLLTANYGSGSVTVHPLLPGGAPDEPSHLVQHTGSGPEPDRQAEPHAHMVAPTPEDGRYLVVDLGADSIFAYDLDAGSGQLVPRAHNRMQPGSGPRHLVFHPSGEYLYLANELGNTVAVCSYDPKTGEVAQLEEHSAAPHPEDARNYPGGIVLSPDARFVYVSNRGDDSIGAFEVRDGGARLHPVGRWACDGSWPRHITLSPDGAFLFSANQRSYNVAVLRVHQDSGQLESTGLSYPVGQAAHVLVG